MIELKETAVTLQQTPILKDISLVFPTGSKTCILVQMVAVKRHF